MPCELNLPMPPGGADAGTRLARSETERLPFQPRRPEKVPTAIPNCSWHEWGWLLPLKPHDGTQPTARWLTVATIFEIFSAAIFDLRIHTANDLAKRRALARPVEGRQARNELERLVRVRSSGLNETLLERVLKKMPSPAQRSLLA